ncbi:MAG TPA: S8 family serine peptidase [Solirubrobacteraceae bacterium]|nr:S8 family serine peptidase [Solirubrobacteraceae bacterium]
MPRAAGALVVVGLAVLAAAPAAAADVPPAAWGAMAPHVLPAEQARIARTQPATWLIGAAPGRQADSIVERHGGRKVSDRGTYVVARGRARRLARVLRAAGLYRFAEPDRPLTRAQAPPGGDDVAATDWRPVINPPAVVPSLANGPLTAVIDDAVDAGHPDLAGVSVARNTTVADWHGTAVASLVGGRANGIGMVGVLPGAPLLSIGTTFTSADVVGAIAHAVDAGARIVSMSFGSPIPSFAEYREIAYAVSQGVLPVAAAGNDRQSQLPDGTSNPVQFPAALPHVLSVASMGPSGASSSFSTSNGAVDVSAPGEAVLAAVPASMDPDGNADGYARVDGTSFAAPIVSGAAAWLLAARPRLQAVQAADLLRETARNIGDRGWDPDSGYGRIDLRAALARAAPPVDPGEVNDDIEWVNGRRFTRPDRLLFRKRHRRRRVDASVDLWKDPADVYRIQVRARTRIRLTMTLPRRHDADLAAFSTRARTIQRARGLLGASLRGAGVTDRVTISATRRSRVVYVAVIHGGPRAEFLNATYGLTVTRLRG